MKLSLGGVARMARYAHYGADLVFKAGSMKATGALAGKTLAGKVKDSVVDEQAKNVLLVQGILARNVVMGNTGEEFRNRGYNVFYAPTFRDLGIGNLEDTAKELRGKIAEVMDTVDGNILMVGHSMGGLVIPAALRGMESDGESIDRLKNLVSISTPWNGSGLATPNRLPRIFKGITAKDQLAVDSEYLQELRSDTKGLALKVLNYVTLGDKIVEVENQKPGDLEAEHRDLAGYGHGDTLAGPGKDEFFERLFIDIEEVFGEKKQAA